ncbi:unnamed protein product, partial [Amoebophrya sp. A25]
QHPRFLATLTFQHTLWKYVLMLREALRVGNVRYVVDEAYERLVLMQKMAIDRRMREHIGTGSSQSGTSAPAGASTVLSSAGPRRGTLGLFSVQIARPEVVGGPRRAAGDSAAGSG